MSFFGISVMSEPPADDAMGLYPFAEVRHSDLAQMELPAGTPSAPRIDVETKALRLHGFVTVSAAVFYPDSPSTFGGLVIPLATNRLQWRETAGDQVLILPGHEPGAPTRIKPEWRDCSYLRLHPRPRFKLALPRTSKLDFARGSYLVRSSPDAPDSLVALELGGDEDIWLLEMRKNWAHILWEGATVAVVGWINRNDGPSPGMGHGSGTGAGHPVNTCGRGRVQCATDVPLFAEQDGRAIEIGSIKRGASMTFRRVRGDYTDVEICDPDVTFVEPVTVKTRDASRCAPTTNL